MQPSETKFHPHNLYALGHYSTVTNDFITTLSDAQQHYTMEHSLQPKLSNAESYKQYVLQIKEHNKQVRALIKQIHEARPQVAGANSWNQIISKYAEERKWTTKKLEEELNAAIAKLKEDYKVKLSLAMDDIKMREQYDKDEYRKGNGSTTSTDPEVRQLQESLMSEKPYKAFKRDAPWGLIRPVSCTHNQSIPKHIVEQDLDARQADWWSYFNAGQIFQEFVLAPIQFLEELPDLPHSAAAFHGYCAQSGIDANDLNACFEFARTQYLPYVVKQIESNAQVKRVMALACTTRDLSQVLSHNWLTTDPSTFDVTES